MFDGLGGHIGAAEGAITIGDDLDIDGAAIGILRESYKEGLRAVAPYWWQPVLHSHSSLSLPFSLLVKTRQELVATVQAWLQSICVFLSPSTELCNVLARMMLAESVFLRLKNGRFHKRQPLYRTKNAH